ncbi:MAG TPA: hypothetical protein DEP01_06035 [Aminobacterium sp.]|nr:hypothetical protein [Aminobacterium sp.]
MADTEGHFAAIILADGSSSRMGTCNPLLSLSKQNFIHCIVTAYRDAGISRLFVVTGPQGELVENGYRFLKRMSLFNKNCHRGIFASVIEGIKAIPSDVKAFFLHSSDTPFVRSSTLHHMLTLWEDTSFLLYPVFQSKRGHPSLISSGMISKILKRNRGNSLADLLKGETAQECFVPDQFISYDVNTSSDFAAFSELYGTRHIPSQGECTELFALAGTPKKIRDHCIVVEKVALRIASELPHFVPCDLQLVLKAALLHDICRKSFRHADVGRLFLSKWGFSQIGELVGSHTDLLGETNSWEAKILYISDKFVKNFSVVPLEKRMREHLDRGRCGEASQKALQRLQKAMEVQEEIEKITGRNLLEIVKGL